MGGHIRVEDANGVEVAKAELAVIGSVIGGEVVSGDRAIRYSLRDDGTVDVRVVAYVDGVESEVGSIHA